MSTIRQPIELDTGRQLETTIDEVVREAMDRYAAKNPASFDLHRRAQGPMPGGNTRTALHFDPFPLYVARSHGSRLVDVDGHEYIDVLGEFTAGLYGHDDPAIRRACVAALEAGTLNGAPTHHEIELAELVCARFPAMKKVRFCNSGTEANLYALTLARIHTGRRRFICFSGAYHGGVFVFAGGGSPMNVPFEWTVCRYNEIEEARRSIAEVGVDLAAVIVEPMMSNGGCIPAEPGFLKALREETEKVGALLILDEIVTSRMGRHGLGAMHDVTADLMTLGKYLGAGFPTGAFGGRSDIMELMDPRRANALPHAGTFNNNVVSMAAGVVGLRDLFTVERAEQLQGDGDALRYRLNERMRKNEVNVQFTGCGSALNVHFAGNAVRRPEDLAGEPRGLFALFQLDLLDAGVYAARRGQINLSLPMGSADFEAIEAAVETFVDRRGALLRSLAEAA